jgi:zinc protease
MTRTPLLAGIALLTLTLPAPAQYPKTPPPAGPLQPAPFPPFQEAVLPNGLRIVVVESHKQPIVSIALAFPAGGFHDPVGKEGLASMTAGLLTKGAGTRSADQIAEAIEGAGGSLGAGAGGDFLTLSASVLTTSLPLAFELMGDAVLRPSFPEKEVELLRTQTLSGLEAQKSQPASLASKAFREAIYGNLPYARNQSPASVKAMTRQDILAFHGQRLKPGGALLVVAGDTNLETVRRLVMQSFKGWLGSAPAATDPRPPAPRTSSTLLLVHRPGSVQSNILVGNLTVPPTDPRNYPLTVANRILGGGADSRLFMILREQKSWTYGAYSQLSRRRITGSFVASAEVRTEVTDSALKEMMVQLRRMGTEPVPSAEFENARNALVGSFPLSIETAEQVAEAVSDQKLYGLPGDYVQTYRVKLGAVTPAEVQAASRALIRPDAAVIVVVGDGAKIYDKIKDVAPVTILDVEGKPLTPADLASKAARLPLNLASLVAQQDSFAILAQGNQLGAMTMQLDRTPEGFRYTEGTNLAGFVQQQTVVEVGPTLQPRSVNQTGTVQGQDTRIEVTFTGGRAKGSATTLTPQGLKTVAIDTTVSPESIEENMVQPLLRALPWSDSAKWTFQLFSTGTGETREVTLAVVGREPVTVPAGSTEAFKIELSGGQQTVHFWVSTAEPHRLMKLAIVGTPIEMVRLH